MRRAHQRAFTLVELLVVIGIIAILGVVSMAAYSNVLQHASSSGCATHMRGIGIAFMSYANDNDGQLPGRVLGDGQDKWPVLLLPYVQDPKSYVDPGDPIAMQVPVQNLAENNGNNSSFFMNGFNDLGFYNNPNATVRLVNITNPTNLIILGQKVHGSNQYYMDFAEGNENDVLNKTAYFGGSNYVFADGSARFMLLADYNNNMWLVDQSYQIPQ